MPANLSNTKKVNLSTKRKRIEKIILQLVKELNLQGFDFDDTHRRVAEMWIEFLYRDKPKLIEFPTRTSSGMVLVKDHIEWGFCPHHLLPVRYKIKIGYTPVRGVLGASKPLRLANWVLRSLPLQEDIPQLILSKVQEAIPTLGCGCIVEGEHLCMRMRGVKSPSTMVTEYYIGWTDEEIRRFMIL